MRVTLVLLADLLIVLVAVGTTRAQCPPAWVPGIGEPGTNGTVNALAVLPGGDVIVCGGFTSAGGGGVAASRIARFDPITGEWSALGSGADSGFVNALAVLPDGDVVAGGSFAMAGGVVSNGIARFNPSTGDWSALGSGVSNPPSFYSIRALAVLPDGDLIVGGLFNSAGGVAASNIARVNATTGVWSALGSGINATAWDVAVLPDGDVIVGGEFTIAGGAAASRIARVNPTTGVWSALGIGANSTVWALGILPGSGDVVVGGQFTTAGGIGASRIARYHPNSGLWTPIGSGTGGSMVNAIEILQGGDLIVAGIFMSAGGAAASNIARVNPSIGVWSALGSGVNAEVRDLALLPGGDLLAGGLFSSAGGSAASRVARYTFGGPVPTISTQPSPQATCPSGSVLFSISGTGSAPITYHWRKNGTPIDTLANPSAATATLTLTNVGPADEASYDCVVTNACGSLTSNPATLTVCAADFTCDGFVDGFDYDAFVTAFEAGEGLAADFNNDGFVDGFDYDDFVTAFELGC